MTDNQLTDTQRERFAAASGPELEQAEQALQYWDSLDAEGREAYRIAWRAFERGDIMPGSGHDAAVMRGDVEQNLAAARAWRAQNELKRRIEAVELPPLETVRARIAEAIRDPEYPLWTAPAGLLASPDAAARFGPDAAAHDPASQTGPDWWALRPHGEPASIQELVDRIAAKPLSPEWVNCPEPEVKSSRPVPFGHYYLREDKRGRLYDETVVRGRTVTPLSDDSWSISAQDPFEPWELSSVPGNPTIEWMLRSHRNFVTPEGRVLQSDCHPDTGPVDPNRAPPEHIGAVDIRSERVYGQATMGLKRLGMHGALEVAISYIELIEWAYGQAERPAWLDGADAAGKPPGSDPALPAPPAPETPEAPAVPEGAAPVPGTLLEAAIAASATEGEHGEPDELQRALEEITASRKGAKANIAAAKACRAAAAELRRQADEAEVLAEEAEAAAEPRRQVLREKAGRLLELLQADEDFPGIA